ncbi:MAG: c-type cytochrome [Acidimicrobiia bacterium]|nr:c-type cytochrome [Acidimicrobiia bacterium]
MSDFLAAAAAAVGGPEDLVMRSARARAEATGASVDDILSAWAGGQAAPAASAPPTPPAEEAAVEPEPAAAEPATPAAAAAPADVPAASPRPQATIRTIPAAPVPETVTEAEALDWDQVTAVKTAGLRERTRSVIPLWLVALFSVIPLFAVGYITVNNNGPTCGDAGQLAVNFRNELVNCDLSAYEGAGGPGGGGAANFVAAGRDVYLNVAQCAGCHGADGGGGAAGPQLSAGAVVRTFSSCTDHIQWVQLGTAGWATEVGPTYGDLAKPTGGFGAQMPGFSTLTDDQLRSVVAFERIIHGLAPADEVLVDCGLVEAPTGDTTPDTTPEAEALAP